MTQDGPSPEELLARFREKGEVEALGALFDATSPTLFRMALALAPDPASAEDAVQETFLTLMAPGSHYDPSRPLLPWMVGILQLKVHEARRRVRRTVDPSRLAPPLFPDDPSRAAETGEEVERVRAALDALPEPYRGVAILRWRYGLEPAAIADARNEPPGTIRSLLHRAQEKLRGTLRTMPAFLLAERAPRGLEAIRSAVMARGEVIVATAAASAGAAVVTGGILMGTKSLVAAAVVLILGGTAWFSLGTNGTRLAVPAPGPVTNPKPVLPPNPIPAPRVEAPEAIPDPPLGPDPATLPPPVDLSKCDRDLDLFGTAVDELGRPVPGARIEAVTHPLRHSFAHSPEAYFQEEVTVETRSAGDGTFSLRLRRGEQVDLRALADGYGQGDRLGCLAGERVTLVLRLGGASVALTVIDEDRIPVPGARAWLSINAPGSYYRKSALERIAITDAQGRCVFRHLPSGQGHLHATHGELENPESVHPEIPDRGSLSLEYVLRRGRAVSGRVTDASTGRPVGGARVGSGYGQERGVATDAEGRYRFPGFTRNGSRGLGVFADGYASQLRRVPDEGEVDFALEPAFAAIGRVVVDGGVAVPGARVALTGFEKGRESWAYESALVFVGADGRFRLEGLSRSCSDHYLAVESRGHGLVAFAFRSPPERDAVVDLGDIVLPAARTIEGRALDAAGEPISGADISVFRFKGPGDPKSSDPRDVGAQGTGRQCRTDDLGRFRFPDLGPGRWFVGLAMPSAPPVETSVELGGEEDVLDVVLAQKGGALAFRVTDAGGKPIPGISVVSDMVFPQSSWGGAAGSIRGVTDAEGRVRFTAIPDVQVGKEKGVRFQVQPVAGADAPPWAGLHTDPLVADGREVHVVLKPVVALRGTVVDPSGAPIPDVVVGAFDPAGKPIGGAVDFTDERGEFTVRLGEGVSAVLKLTGEGGAVRAAGGGTVTGTTPWRAESEVVRAPAGGIVLRAKRLSVDGGLDLVVLDLDSNPVADYRVFAMRSGDGRSGKTDGTGRIHWEGMIEETWRLLPDTAVPRGLPDEAVAPAALDVVPRGQEILLRFRRGVAVDGVVLLPDGTPAPGAHLGFNLRDGGGGPGRPPKTDEHGKFRLWFGEGDEFRLMAGYRDDAGRVYRAETADLKPGVGEVEIRLAPE